jgi:DNA repair exonuclease SbcCD ATPase subunit
MSTIEIRDIGPVEHVSIPVPESGGVVVLKARNGRGKTNTLQAVETIATGKGSLSVRDGALRGEVSGWGAKVTVGRSTRRTGELEVYTLEGKLSIADLVDPGLKSDEAADARRIRALASLTADKVDASRFFELLGGKDAFLEIVSPSAMEGDDWVAVADKIKRDIEREARKEEALAEHADGLAVGLMDGEEFDPNEDIPSIDFLRKEQQNHAAILAAMRAKKESAEKQLQRQEEARRLVAEQSSDTNERVEALHAEKEKRWAFLRQLSDQHDAIAEEIRLLEAKIQQLLPSIEVARIDHEHAEEQLADAIKKREELASLQQIIDTPIDAPSSEDIVSIELALSIAESNVEKALKRTEQRRRHQEAMLKKGVAEKHRKIAERLRDAATRKAISEHAKERGVVVITAECSDDESIVAEEYSA